MNEKIYTIELTEIQKNIILTALQGFWLNSHTEMETGKTTMSDGTLRPLGDLEKEHAVFNEHKSKTLIRKLELL